ncbi:MAG: hypothetical protein L6N95_00560 [Candidatus Methylarchaceae archaeon HK01B]|nr:hypothetical protein [Candidatus Methylarchaceae archaeon HK01B]
MISMFGGEALETTFDSVYIIRKDKYEEFVADASKLALAAYTIPAFIWLELYTIIDMERDIAMRVIWKPETTVKQIKEFDKTWFLEKY